MRIEEINKLSDDGYEILKDLVEENSGDLDLLVNEIVQEILNENNYSNIIRYSLELPILIYHLSSNLEKLGLKMDFADVYKNDRYSRMMLNASGTIPEKTARANLFVSNDAYGKEIFDRAYFTLKSKLDNANNILISIRGILNSMEKEKIYG